MPGFEAATWFGLFGPASMPADLREKIYKDTERVVADPSMTQKLIQMGGVVNNIGPQAFQEFIQAEAKRWSEAVKLSGARID
jgi:tripartite-type tricarboxylate transporter receptor subunit TctC